LDYELKLLNLVSITAGKSTKNQTHTHPMKYQLILLLLIAFLSGCKKDEPIIEVKACFDFQSNSSIQGEYQFTNCSENATSYLWKFSDGQTSIEKEPKHLFAINSPLLAILIAYNGNESDTLLRNLRGDIMVYKPNVYIYPLQPTDLCVRLTFPMGGKIVESIPAYEKGWCVNVYPSGRIDNQYDYLFYESSQPNLFQYNKGWCIAQGALKTFFERNMKAYNFSAYEIKDFTDYWIPVLNESNYYCIYPQTNEILDKTIQLDFSIHPDHLYRLFYGVIGIDQEKELEAPEIKPFERSGFYAVEWGVFRE